MKYSLKEFKEILQNRYNEPFEIVSYNGTSKSGIYKCGYCNKEYHLPKMGKLINENRKHLCTHCFSSKYAEQSLELIKLYKNLEFSGFGYNDNLHKPTIIYKCKECGAIVTKPLIEFIKYPKCYSCGPNAKKRTPITVNSLLPEGFNLIGNYINQYEKTLVRHNTCGFIFNIRPKDLINGHSYCPKCSKKASKGERKIIEFLQSHNISFIKEKIFDWSEKKRYDFYLEDYNLVIEYMGIQHYKEVPNFFLPLHEQQLIDQWKQEQAKTHNLSYLAISYLDYNHIEDILAQRLKEIT